MKSLLIIKAGHTVRSLLAQQEDFEDWIIQGSGAREAHFQVISVFKGESLPDVSRYRGVIITGSPANITDGPPWMDSTCEWIRKAIRQDLPVLGICFGHQLLAHSLGGEVDFHPAGREIGTIQVFVNEAGGSDPLLKTLPRCFHAQSSHQQTVIRLPDGAVILAGNEFDAHHAVRFDRRVWGLQFHPEFSSRIMVAYIKERRSVLEQEGFSYPGLLANVRETPAAESLLQRFADLASAE